MLVFAALAEKEEAAVDEDKDEEEKEEEEEEEREEAPAGAGGEAAPPGTAPLACRSSQYSSGRKVGARTRSRRWRGEILGVLLSSAMCCGLISSRKSN